MILPALDDPHNADATQQLQSLAQQGRILEATLLAERTFGWNTTEARIYVEQLASRR